MDPLTLALLSLFIGTGTGLITSSITEQINESDATEEFEKQKNYLEEQKRIDEEALENSYLNEKAKAYDTAAKADADATKTENFTSEDFNLTLSNMFLEQTAAGAQFNQANMQIGQNKGAGLAQSANAGVRAGSSLTEAVDLEAAVNSSQLQQQEDLQRANNNNNLSSLLNNLAKQEYGIFQERRGADDLRNSFNEGGYDFTRYQNSKTEMQDKYTLAMKKMTDEYDDYMSKKSKNRRVFTGWLGNGSQAFKTSYNLGSLFLE